MIVRAAGEQGAQLAGVERTAGCCGRAIAGDVPEVDGGGIVILADLSQPAGFFQHPPERDEHLVGGGRGVALLEHGADSSGVLVAECAPGEGEGIGLLIGEDGGDGIEGLAHRTPAAGGEAREVDGSRMAVQVVPRAGREVGAGHDSREYGVGHTVSCSSACMRCP